MTTDGMNPFVAMDVGRHRVDCKLYSQSEQGEEVELDLEQRCLEVES